MKISWRKTFAPVIVSMLCASLIGCSSGSSNTSGNTNNPSGSDFAGDATISGSITALSSDIASVQSSSGDAQNFLNGILSETGNERRVSGGVARLYHIKSDGTREYTGVKVDVDQNGNYSFTSIKDGNLYIVEYKKIGVNSLGRDSALVLSGIVDTTTEASTFSSDLSPVSGMILDVFIEEVFSKLETNQVDNLGPTIAAYQSTIERLVTAGTIQIASSIQSFDPETDIGETDPTDKDEVVFQEKSGKNEQNIEKLKADEDIESLNTSAELNAFLNKSVSDLSDDEAQYIIRQIFQFAFDTADIPDFYIESFANKYREGKLTTVTEIATALHDAVFGHLTDLKENFLTAAVIQADLLEAVNGEQSKVDKLYKIYDGDSDDLITEAPLAYRSAFPNKTEKRWTLPISASQQMTLPQAILVLSEAGYLGDAPSFPEGYEDTSEYQNFFANQQNNDHIETINPIDFIQKVGFIDELEAGEVVIVEGEAVAVRAHVQTEQKSQGSDFFHWEEVDALEVRVQTYEGPGDDSIAKVVFKYPKQGDTTSLSGSVELEERSHQGPPTGDPGNNENQENQNPNNRVSLASLALQEGQPQEPQRPSQREFFISPYFWFDSGDSEPTIISDYVTGTGVIQILNSDDEVIASKEVALIKANIPHVDWITPAGRDINSFFGGGTEANKVEVFSLEEGDESLENLVLEWEAADNTAFPTAGTDYEIRYYLELRLVANRINHNEPMDAQGDWDFEDDFRAEKTIFQSDYSRPIRGTSFKLKEALAPTEFNTERNYSSRYEAHLRPVIIKNPSAPRIVWEGSDSFAEFFVADPTKITEFKQNNDFAFTIDDNWTATINGSIHFDDITDFVPVDENGDEISGTWKIGLIAVFGPTEGNSNQFEPKYHTDENGPRTPAQNSGGTLVLVDELGSTGTISEQTVSYAFPAITRDDEVLTKNTEYAFIIWYDQATAPENRDDWDTYLTGDRTAPVDNGVDFVDFHNLETAFNPFRHIRMEHGSVFFEGRKISNKPDETINFEIGERDLFF